MGSGGKSGEIRSYKDLIVWQRAFGLGKNVYLLTSAFPPEEKFGLTAQLRRAAVSIASNIAEGYGRGGRSEYLRFLRIARGSLFEVETQVHFAAEFGFISIEDFQSCLEKIIDTARVLSGLIRRLEGTGN
jgi:four helix bundle protein